MIVGAFSSLERRVGAKIKKSSRMEERVAPAQEEWQQIIIKNIYVYILDSCGLRSGTKTRKKAIPELESDNACMPAKLERHTNFERFAC